VRLGGFERARAAARVAADRCVGELDVCAADRERERELRLERALEQRAGRGEIGTRELERSFVCVEGRARAEEDRAEARVAERGEEPHRRVEREARLEQAAPDS
jgi:hypothetical protein